MAVMIVAHPIPGFSGRVTVEDVGLSFIGGFTGPTNVPTGVQAQLVDEGFTLNASPSNGYPLAYVTHQELEDPDSEPSVALRAAFASRASVLAGAPAPLVTTHTRTVLKNGANDVRVVGQRPSNGELVGVNQGTGTFNTSLDNGTTWTERFVGPFGAYGSGISGLTIQYDEAAGFMWVATSDGRVLRAPIGAYNTNPWVSKGPTVPAGTTANVDVLCCLGNGVLLYGNYNQDATAVAASIWRSTDSGNTWTKVLNLPGARHVHSVQADPRKTGRVWAMVGDLHPGRGLYRSEDAGVTWTLIDDKRYGIGMAFPIPFAGAPELVVSEGDGLNEPHLIGYDTAAGGRLEPLVWFDKPPSDATSNRGTARGIHATTEGHVVYFITPEGGAVGTKAGLYVAQGPLFNRTVLLEDLTGVEPVAYFKTYRSGNFLINGAWRWTVPSFAGDSKR